MINVTKAYLPDRRAFDAYVDRIFDSGWLTNNGQLVQLLEKRLAQYLGVRNLILVSNGTQALQIAFKALELRRDVITTPFSFVATTSALVWEGLNPIFADINPRTLCLDPEQIERTLTPMTSGIVPVHVFGGACDVDRIHALAQRHGLRVVYDASHAFGVRYKGQSLLNFGDIATLSFHATKLFHTVEGGAIITSDDALQSRLRQMINFGIVSPTTIVGLGINAKMNEFQAAMGLCVLDDIELISEQRRLIDARYRTELEGVVEFPDKMEGVSSNYGYFPVVFESEGLLLNVVEGLQRVGIDPRRYFYPSLDTLPYVDGGTTTVSRDVSSRVLCLPIYPGLPESAQAEVIAIVRHMVLEY
jgi:dTDP-4-amino-4,6-dideoxygalactose transaminase